MTHRTVSFDGMCWPLPNEEVEDRLRYVTIDRLKQVPLILDKNDLMVAAQIMSAYRALISKTRDQRQKIVSMIRSETKRKYRFERDSDDRSKSYACDELEKCASMKPCQNCGSIDTHVVSQKFFRGQCNDCGELGPVSKTIEESIELWDNCRISEVFKKYSKIDKSNTGVELEGDPDAGAELEENPNSGAELEREPKT